VAVELYFDDEYIAGMPVVNEAVYRGAVQLRARWIAAAAPHTRTGRFVGSIGIERANDKDYWVYADAPYAIPLEFGHDKVVFGKDVGGRVEGIHLLRKIL